MANDFSSRYESEGDDISDEEDEESDEDAGEEEDDEEANEEGDYSFVKSAGSPLTWLPQLQPLPQTRSARQMTRQSKLQT